MTEINYDLLNEAASAVWEAARTKGIQEGKQEQLDTSSDWHTRGNLDLVKSMIRNSIGAEQEVSRLMALYSKTLLSRTPQIHPCVSDALSRLKQIDAINDSRKVMPRGQLEAVLRVVESGLEALGGYR